jgi:hypothetical protein
MSIWEATVQQELKDAYKKNFDRYREAELKHGRVAMLAVVGYLIPEIARFPGCIDLTGTTFQSIPNGVAALSVIHPFGWFQIGASIGYWEIFGWEQRPNEPIGDFGFYYLGDKEVFTGVPIDQAEKKMLHLKELQNGRLAMFGIGELLTHDFFKPAGESLFTIHHF